MQTTLATLRDIEGVLGSFLVDEAGQLMARDMPGVFDDATLNSASLRLSRLRGALESEAPSFSGCVARFGDHLLVVRPVANRLLCVLVPRGANLTALQMGTNLVSRRLANKLQPVAETTPAATPIVGAPAEVTSSTPSPAPSAPLPTPTGTLPRLSPPNLEGARPSLLPLPVAAVPAATEAAEPSRDSNPDRTLSGLAAAASVPGTAIVPNATIALLAQTKLAPSDVQEPQRDSTPLADPHPTRSLPKRFFRGRPVP